MLSRNQFTIIAAGLFAALPAISAEPEWNVANVKEW
jgi:hypothetical protein